MKFTVIYDNRTYQEGWETGWGFSCLVDNGKETVLFDTGDNPHKTVSNFIKSGKDIKKIAAITFSHKHWNHVDGLKGILNINKTARIYIPSSFPKKITSLVKENGNEIIYTGEKVEKIEDGIFITPAFDKFFTPAEQGLILETEIGLALITGCAHPGILNMVKKTNELFNRKVMMISGGFHLSAKTAGKVRRIIRKLKEEGVRYFSPSHCTGKKAMDIFKRECSENYIETASGKSLNLDKLK